jgi:outer membrane protein assembly factor BamB
MKKCYYELCEVFSDNGEHSHWRIIDCDTGVIVWSQDAEEDIAKGVDIYEKPHITRAFSSICDAHDNGDSCLQAISSFRFVA